MKRAALAAVAALLALTVPATSASSQTNPDSSGSAKARVTLLAQSTWLRPGGQLDLTLDIEGEDDEELDVAVSVHQPVTSRSSFQRTLTGDGLGSILSGGFVATPLSELERGPGGSVFIRLPLQDPSQPRDRQRLQATRPGVYPVEVDLRASGTAKPLSRFVTHLVLVSSEPIENPLKMSWVLPIHRPPEVRPDGTISRVDPARGPGTIARALDTFSSVPITIEPTPETLLTLERGPAEDGRTLDRLQAVADRTQVIASPFVPFKTGALDPLPEERALQTSRGNEVLTVLLGVRPDPRTRTLSLDEGLDSNDRSVDRVVVPEQLLVAERSNLTPTGSFRLLQQGQPGPAAFAGDSGLAQHFNGEAKGALAAHNLLADLAVLYFDSPGSKDRGVVTLTPRDWAVDGAMLESALAGLASSPLIDTLRLDRLFEQIPPASSRGRPATRALAEQPDGDLPASSIRRAREQVNALGSVATRTNPMVVHLSDAVLAAQSADLRLTQTNQRLRSAVVAVEQQTEQISTSTAPTVTLTARRGGVPITLSSTADFPTRVRVSLASSKLRFPDGNSQVVDLTRQNTTVRFTVEARTSGSFPLTVMVTSPDGNLDISQTRLTVRSTAASGVGILLSAGAAGFLAIWWARNIFGRRRSQG